MTSRHYPSSPLLAACTAIWRGEKILLARRSVSPNEGTWAMPGGMVELGETLEQAAIREVKEETALTITNPAFNRFHEIIMQDADGKTERHYVIAMFAAVSPSGIAIAGDDAAAVGWFTLDDLADLPLTASSETFIRESLALIS